MAFSSYSHRIFIYGPFAALLALAIGYSIYWRVEASDLSAKLDAANQHDVLPGLHFAFAEKTVGGFPFRLDVVLSGVTLSTRGPGGETAWRSEKLAIHALAYGGGQYLFESAGLQSVAYPAPGIPAQVYYVTPGTARASAILNGGKLARIDLDVAFAKGEDATASQKSGGDYQPRDFLVRRAQFHARLNGEMLDVVLRIDDAKLGNGYVSKLGNQIGSAELDGSVTQAKAFDAVLSGDGALSDAFSVWRRANGALQVDSLVVNSEAAKNETLKGNLSLNADGDLAGKLSSPSGLLSLILP